MGARSHMIDIKILKPNPENPRTIKKEAFAKLKKKIQAFPQMLEKRPIVYDSSQDYLILGGNRRYDAVFALHTAGEIELKDEYFSDCKDWTDAQKKEFVLIDNITDGDWDYDKLANQYEAPELEEMGFDLVGLYGEEDSEKKERLDQTEEKKKELVTCPKCGHEFEH